jgi:hypothetical protein
MPNNIIIFEKITKHIKSYELEYRIFIFSFIIMLSFMSSEAIEYFGNIRNSINNVEQWINLTNASLYGKQDFLFSYGPIYWITGGAANHFNNITYLIVLFITCFINSLGWSFLVALSIKKKAITIFTIVYIVFAFTPNFNRYMWLLIPLIFVLYSDLTNKSYFNKSKVLISIGFITGILFYVRFMYGLIATAIFGSYLFYDFLTNKKIKNVTIFSLSILTSFLLSGVFIFHNVENILQYLLINQNLSFGNSIDMTLDVVDFKWIFLIVFSMFSVGVIYLFKYRRSFLFVFIISFLLFFKLGFSRTDHYISYFIYPILFLSFVFLFDERKLGKLVFFIFTIGLVFMGQKSVYENGRIAPFTFMSKINSIALKYKESYFKRMALTYDIFKLDTETKRTINQKTIDFYPYNNEYAFANNLNYVHRPNFQSYMTLTPQLGRMNQDFIESKSGPQFILWSPMIGSKDHDNFFDAFDNKYILNEDPLTALSILTNYHPVLKTFSSLSSVVLLERNKNIIRNTPKRLKEEIINFDQWYSVPSLDTGIKIIPQFELTLYGKIKNLLFRGSIIKIQYKLITNETKEYRLNFINSQDGVWVSPFLKNFDLSGLRVKEIKFHGGNNYVKRKFKVRWLSVNLSKNIK